MLLTEKLEHHSFSNSEQTIVDYILKQQLDIENKTTSQIANETFSSKSTLVRLAQKLGYSGWQEFKTAYIQEIKYLTSSKSGIDANVPFNKNDHIIAIAQKIATLKKEVIDDTIQLLRVDTLNQALKILEQAQTIHVFAVSNNNLLPMPFQQKMSRIRKHVQVYHLEGEQYFNAYLAQPGSCALMISYSGETTALINIAKILKGHKIPIVLLTSVGDSSLSPYASCCLYISTKEKLYSKISTFSTEESITYLLDLLYSGIFAKNYDENLAFKIKAAEIIESDRLPSSEIMREE